MALPGVFAPPASAPDFSIPVEPSIIERRILATQCDGISEEMSLLAMDSGLMTRPPTSAGVYIDKGNTPDGTKWFLHRAADDPETTYCGIAFIGSGQGTNISVTGLRSRDMEAARIAIESGDFLCRCKQLSE